MTVQGTWDDSITVPWEKAIIKLGDVIGKDNTAVVRGEVVPDKKDKKITFQSFTAVIKIYDMKNAQNNRRANDEIAAYGKLEKLQGMFIPRLYAAGTVWNMLKVLVLEDCGQGANEVSMTTNHCDKVRAAVGPLHMENVVHGDIELDNFAILGERVRLIDLERCKPGNRNEIQREKNDVQYMLKGLGD
ncbi:hypothetical protein H072_3922 [Dactylellina haptotyla CBS 200.50]|uniref:Protein kinase domain-containing protein n=1 Tax=Dactylellina haptotyla (strain CBS 200.50) TaxID=1284197 RepID=S8BRR8_DACHA|nr:hypothetical protein H072_3922 [Dactylellina haptotyla CBS 200.50]